MDVPPVFASAQLTGAPVVSVVSAVVSMSPLSSLELDGSPVTQLNKADAAIWNSYRNAFTSPTQTSTIIENQLSKVVDNTDLLPPLLNLGISTSQTPDSVWGSPSGAGVGELLTQATWLSSTFGTMTFQGPPSGREPVSLPLLPLECTEARAVKSRDSAPDQGGYEAGNYLSEDARHGDAPVTDTSAEVLGMRLRSPDTSSAGDWQSDDDQPQAAADAECDVRREEAQGTERRMDNYSDRPSSPFASPSFLDCLAANYDRTDSPLNGDHVAFSLSPGERSEVSQSSDHDLEANRVRPGAMNGGMDEASRPTPATPESAGASSRSGRQEVRLGLSPKVIELRPEAKVVGRSRVGRCAVVGADFPSHRDTAAGPASGNPDHSIRQSIPLPAYA